MAQQLTPASTTLRVAGCDIPAAKPSVRENRWVGYYSEDGLTIEFGRKGEFEHAVFAPEDLIRGRPHTCQNLRFPVKIRLNVPWSLSASPGQPLSSRVCQAVLWQAGAMQPATSTCTLVQGEFSPSDEKGFSPERKCVFSRFFGSHSTDTHQRHSQLLSTILAELSLDDIALFAQPELVTLRFKEVEYTADTMGTTNNWYVDQGCTGKSVSPGSGRSCCENSRSSDAPRLCRRVASQKALGLKKTSSSVFMPSLFVFSTAFHSMV